MNNYSQNPNLFEFIHINGDTIWIDMYHAENLAKAYVKARKNHDNKPRLQLIWIQPEMRHALSTATPLNIDDLN